MGASGPDATGMPVTPPSPSSIPANVSRDVTAFARALVTAARALQMYSAGHPNARAAAEQCRSTLEVLAAHEQLVIGVTPQALLVNGSALPGDARVREACAMLNEKDVIRLRLTAPPLTQDVSDFLHLLATDADDLRQHGGPAVVWKASGRPWLQLDQIDYDRLLTSAALGAVVTAARPEGSATAHAGVARDDEIWSSLVRAMAHGHAPIDTRAERRLMDIAHSAEAIAALAADAADAQTGTGSVLEATRAAAVLTTYQRLATFVELQAPGDTDLVVNNIATASGKTDPALFMRAVSEAAESGVGVDVVAAVGARFTDQEASQLLAASMAVEGKASSRMAAALTTLVPDEERRDRVLRLARQRTVADRPADSGDLAAAWAALDCLLAGPADADYVSRLYGETLEYAEARSNRLRLDAPQKLDQWTRSISFESVRALSTTLLLDLFGLEQDPDGARDTARDLAFLAEDLLQASDLDDAARVVHALHEASNGEGTRADAARTALGLVRHSAAVAEAAAAIGEFDDDQFDAFARICRQLGPELSVMLVSVLGASTDDVATDRLRSLVADFGQLAVDAAAAAADAAGSESAMVYIRLIRQLGGSRAVAALQSFARSPKAGLAALAVGELLVSEDPAAWKALHGLVTVGDESTRMAAIDITAASRHPKAGALLALALGDLEPLDRDWTLCRHVLQGLHATGARDAVSALAGAMRAMSWRAWRRALRVKREAVALLARANTPDAHAALDAAARDGDFFLRRLAASARRAGA
jgi:hypothetical protein